MGGRSERTGETSNADRFAWKQKLRSGTRRQQGRDFTPGELAAFPKFKDVLSGGEVEYNNQKGVLVSSGGQMVPIREYYADRGVDITDEEYNDFTRLVDLATSGRPSQYESDEPPSDDRVFRPGWFMRFLRGDLFN